MEIDIHKYKLQNLLTEVYGDLDIELGMKGTGMWRLSPRTHVHIHTHRPNPAPPSLGPAVDINKKDKVLSTTLFSVTFMLGPVPITVSLDLEVRVAACAHT